MWDNGVTFTAVYAQPAGQGKIPDHVGLVPTLMKILSNPFVKLLWLLIPICVSGLIHYKAGSYKVGFGLSVIALLGWVIVYMFVVNIFILPKPPAGVDNEVWITSMMITQFLPFSILAMLISAIVGIPFYVHRRKRLN